jgi:hypothetical protein
VFFFFATFEKQIISVVLTKASIVKKPFIFQDIKFDSIGKNDIFPHKIVHISR